MNSIAILKIMKLSMMISFSIVIFLMRTDYNEINEGGGNADTSEGDDDSSSSWARSSKVGPCVKQPE